MVRPWNDPSAATRWVRPVRRVSLRAASLASVPELVKNTLPGLDSARPPEDPARPPEDPARPPEDPARPPAFPGATSSTCGGLARSRRRSARVIWGAVAKKLE